MMRGVCALNMETMSILNQNGILVGKEWEGSNYTNNNNNNCLPNPSADSQRTVSYVGSNGKTVDVEIWPPDAFRSL